MSWRSARTEMSRKDFIQTAGAGLLTIMPSLVEDQGGRGKPTNNGEDLKTSYCTGRGHPPGASVSSNVALEISAFTFSVRRARMKTMTLMIFYHFGTIDFLA